MTGWIQGAIRIVVRSRIDNHCSNWVDEANILCSHQQGPARTSESWGKGPIVFHLKLFIAICLDFIITSETS